MDDKPNRERKAGRTLASMAIRRVDV